MRSQQSENWLHSSGVLTWGLQWLRQSRAGL